MIKTDLIPLQKSITWINFFRPAFPDGSTQIF